MENSDRSILLVRFDSLLHIYLVLGQIFSIPDSPARTCQPKARQTRIELVFNEMSFRRYRRVSLGMKIHEPGRFRLHVPVLSFGRFPSYCSFTTVPSITRHDEEKKSSPMSSD